MTFRDLLRDTIATLWAHKRRTLLTMFGIAWGIISITVMVAAGEGLGRGIQKQQENFGKDVMIIFSGRTSMQAGGARSGRVVHWMEDDYKEVAKESPACKYVMPELGNNVKVHSAFNSGDIDTVGSLPPFAIIRSVERCARAAFTTTKTMRRAAVSLSSAAIPKSNSSPNAKPSVKPSNSMAFPTRLSAS